MGTLVLGNQYSEEALKGLPKLPSAFGEPERKSICVLVHNPTPIDSCTDSRSTLAIIIAKNLNAQNVRHEIGCGSLDFDLTHTFQST